LITEKAVRAVKDRAYKDRGDRTKNDVVASSGGEILATSG